MPDSRWIPPKSGEEDDTRFALTSEAGLNDGLAFPFVMCAIALVETGGEGWVLRWLGLEVVWRLTAGVVVGVLLGYALGWLALLWHFRLGDICKEHVTVRTL